MNPSPIDRLNPNEPLLSAEQKEALVVALHNARVLKSKVQQAKLMGLEPSVRLEDLDNQIASIEKMLNNS